MAFPSLAGALALSLCPGARRARVSSNAAAARRRRSFAAAVQMPPTRLRDDIWRLEAAAAARDRAEAANEAKSRFLATVSHEIRTPLAGIIGTAELLATLPLEAEAASYVGAIRTSGAALRSLIDEILDFSRIEAGQFELADETFELLPLVEGVVELLAPRAQDQGPRHRLPPRARRSAHACAAIRRGCDKSCSILPATPSSSPRRAASACASSRATARCGSSVSDTGPRRRVRIAATRSSRSSSRAIIPPRARHGGAGLGLAISRAIAHRMGGALTLDESSPDGIDLHADALPCATRSAAALAHGAPRDQLPTSCSSRDAPFEAPFLRERLASSRRRRDPCRDGGAVRSMLVPEHPTVRHSRSRLRDRRGRRAPSRGRPPDRAGVARAVVLLSPFERRALSPAAWRDFDGWLVKPVREASLRLCLDPRTQAGGWRGRTERCARAAPRWAACAGRGRRRDQCPDRATVCWSGRARASRAFATARRRWPVGVPAAGVDVVLMDIRMPVLDGLPPARLIRAADKAAALPLIALSANAFDEDRRSGAGRGIRPVPRQAGRPGGACAGARSAGRCSTGLSEALIYRTPP